MINVKLCLLIQDRRKNVKVCYCVCFRSGNKVQSGLIQIQLNPLTLPDTIDYLLLKKRNFKKKLQFFSSPEHIVLMVSFCDRQMSDVRRASCVVHNFFKHLLLLNHCANLDETWQGCSLGKALPKLFKRLNSTHNSGCHGNQ